MLDVEELKAMASDAFKENGDLGEHFEMCRIIGQLEMIYAIKDLGDSPSMEAVQTVMSRFSHDIMFTAIKYMLGFNK